MRAYDIMGNELSGETLPLNRFPIYLKTSRSMKELENAFSALRLTRGDAVSAGISVADRQSFDVRISNRNNRPLSGRVAVALEGQKQEKAFSSIPAEESRTIRFQTPKPISTTPQTGHLTVKTGDSELRKEFQLKATFVPRNKGKIVIDGDLGDWPKTSPLTLSAARNARKITPALWRPEDKTIRAELKTAWDDSAFYLAVTVYKPNFVQTSNTAAEIWRGDSIQIGFDPLKNADPTMSKYQDDDFEYAVSLLNGQPAIYRQYASSAVHDSLLKSTGELKNGTEVHSAIRIHPDRTIYELAFTPRAVSPFKLKAGHSMRWNIIVNLNNGKGRIGYLELTDGIGGKKRPGQFMDLVLLP